MIKQLNILDKKIAEQVLQIQIPAYLVEADLIGIDEIPPLKDTVGDLQYSVETFFGYYQEETLAGVISFQIIDDILDIHRVVVHPSYFRRGIGKVMMTFLIANYDSEVKGFKVQTASANIPAINLYQSLGFQIVDQLDVSSSLSLTIFYLDQGNTHR